MELRDRLILALDVDDLVVALRLADQLKPWFAVAKVGLELFTAAGPDAVTSVADAGFKVFLDLKLHDIPTTVRKSARVVGALGASYLTLHARAGAVMLRAGVDGLREGAAAGGLPEPTALAVTILTSDADAPAHILGGRVAAAVESGCGGVIVAAADVHEAKQLAPRLLAVVPGIRLGSGDAHDQARAASPRDAFLEGA
ncbi:MAG: orotidine-5-phosphate decarboxylase, partial [Actinomycetota bacterium]|nr:orotidine-5-phosphate decarboxylase [Actinomycetota bacterium]